MSQHTPGPWVITTARKAGSCKLTCGDHTHDFFTATELCVGRLTQCGCNQWDEAQANARLIAAAPELLEALELLMSARDNDGVICPSGIVVAQVKSAIANAKGEQK